MSRNSFPIIIFTLQKEAELKRQNQFIEEDREKKILTRSFVVFH